MVLRPAAIKERDSRSSISVRAPQRRVACRGTSARVAVFVISVSVLVGLLGVWSATSGASAKTSTRSTSRLSANGIIGAPIGYRESSGSGASNGPVTPAAFDNWIGTGSATSFGYSHGYDVTYDATATSESIEVTVFAFHSHADASAFEGAASAGWNATSLAPARKTIRAIAGSVVEIGSKAGSDGFYVADAFARKGSSLMIIEYANASKIGGIPPALKASAVSQYERL
jgi:hypothetical protein